jgi:hypothetical protein
MIVQIVSLMINEELNKFPLKGHYAKKKVTVAVTIGLISETQNGVIDRPFIIFKSDSVKFITGNSIKENLANSVEITHTKSGWETPESMSRWCDRFIEFIGELQLKAPFLILDGFYAHRDPIALKKLRDSNVTVQFLPGGCTPILQPLDVSINKSLKTHIRSSYSEYLQKAGIGQVPSHESILRWIVAYINTIDASLIYSAMRICGIGLILDKDTVGLLNKKIKELGDDITNFINEEHKEINGESFNPYLDETEMAWRDLIFSETSIEKLKELFK